MPSSSTPPSSSSSSSPASSPISVTKPVKKGSPDRECGGCSSGGKARAKAPKQCSKSPVYYYNGEVSLQDSDLPGPVPGFGHTRCYSNQLAPTGTDPGMLAGPNGNNILNPSLPYIVKIGTKDPDYILMMGQTRIWFDDSFVAQYGADDTYSMTHESGNKLWVVQVNGGSGVMTYEFQDDAAGNSNPAGLFYRRIDAYGNETKVENYGADWVEEVRYKSEAGGDAAYSILYAHYGSGAHTDRIETATLRSTTDDTAGTITWTDVRRAAYTYYGASESHGSQNDLKLVTQQTPGSGGSWDDAAQCYYRWYKDGDTDGFEGALKYAVGMQAYAEMILDGKTPETASDGDVADYAENYFEYDNTATSHKVTKEIAKDCAGCGGGGTGDSGETFTTTTSANADAYNNWTTKTVLTKANGNVVTVYANYLGQVMLQELKEDSSSSRKWISYTKYGTSATEAGKVVQSASPAAVNTYSDTNADLGVTLHSDAGLVTHYTYGTTTGASGETLGDVTGYLKLVEIEEGNPAIPARIKQREVQYKSSTNTTGEKAYVVGKETRYQDEASGGSDPVATEFSYTWHSAPHETAIETVVTKLPIVATGQNGDGVQYYTRRRMDTNGRVTLSQDERDILTSSTYNDITGRMTQRVADAAKPGSGYPAGWPDPPTTNEEVTTTYSYDSLGRQIESLGEAHDADISGTSEEVQHATWTVYIEAVTGNQAWTGRGYHKTAGAGTDVLVNPVSIAINDKRGRTTDSIQSARSSGSGKLSATDEFDRVGWSRWSVSLYTTKGQLQYQRVYFDIPGQIPDQGLAGVTLDPGTQGTNYEETHHLYEDETNLRIKSISADETISRTVYDAINRTSSQWIGTDDTSATPSDPTGGSAAGNNMVKVSENTYDAGAAGGNSFLTKVEQFADGSDTRTTTFTYDFRGRRLTTDGEETLYIESTYDNLNRVTKVEQYNTTSSASNLIGKQESFYDDRGRVYQTKTYGVDPGTGTVGEHLVGNSFFDPAGNLLKSIAPGSGLSWTQTEYDNLGRPTRSYSGYDDLAAPDDEVVIEESLPTYNIVSQVLSTQRKQRDTGSSIASPTFRSLYAASWYDGAGRSIGAASYGTNGGSAFTRPSTVPGRSDSVLVSTSAYNDAGEAYTSTDPKDIETRREFDQMGRVTKQLDNYKATPSGADQSRATEFTYTADSQQETITAAMGTGTGDDEVTTYVYGVDSASGSDLAANNLLFAIQYPTDSTSSRIELKYNRLGQVIEREDQNGTIHAYEYDGLGRPIRDGATLPDPTTIDDAVLALTTVYNSRGQAQTLTSHDNTAGSGGVVNQVELEYNDFGQLTSDWQEHDGTVTTSGGSASLRMQYAFTDASGTAGTAAANRIRPDLMTYPDGRETKFGYDGENGINDPINRVSQLKEDNGSGGWRTIVRNWFLGAGQSVIVDYSAADIKLNQWGNTGGTYIGLDDFNRPTEFAWSESSTKYAELEYGYDRDSLPNYREDLQAQANSEKWDELYGRDGLNRLNNFQRGELNAGHTSITTLEFEQDWTLDQVANWTGFNQDDDGAGGNDLEQSRTHNKSNEITDITNAKGGAWVDPTYDSAGNTTKAPSPLNPTVTRGNQNYTYDAWNRLVKVTNSVAGNPTLGAYAYDARGFRIEKKEYDTSGGHDATRDYYYTSSWQCIEERITDVATSTTTLDRQYIWGLRYIDELVRRDRDTTGNGTLDETLYALNDRQFNVIALWDDTAGTSGEVVERMAYDPYGNPQFLNEDFTTKASSSYEWDTLFQGLHRDKESGLYYNRARILHTLLGRFLQRDPLGYPDGLNAYAAYHVMASLQDPFGLARITNWGYQPGPDVNVPTGNSRQTNLAARSRSATWTIENLTRNERSDTYTISYGLKSVSSISNASATHTTSISSVQAESVSVGQTDTFSVGYVLSGTEEEYDVYRGEWEVYKVNGEFLEAVACWMVTGNPAHESIFKKVKTDTYLTCTDVFCAKISTLRPIPRSRPILTVWLATSLTSVSRIDPLTGNPVLVANVTSRSDAGSAIDRNFESLLTTAGPDFLDDH